MTINHGVFDPRAATARDVDPVIEPRATCPLCHTADVFVSDDTLAAGGGWRCTRCGQQWDARRLETVAAYASSLRRGTRDVSARQQDHH